MSTKIEDLGKEKYLWIAGLLEGEGCFRIEKDQRKPHSKAQYVRIACEMTDKDTIERLQQYAGVGQVHSREPRKLNGDVKSRKPTWAWEIGAMDDVYELLENILPYMGQRRTKKIQQALNILQKKIEVREKKKTNPVCRECGVPLTEKNRHKTEFSHYEYICKKCKKNYYANHYREAVND